MTDTDQIAAEAADLWMQGEVALGHNRQDEAALRDIIKTAIEKAYKDGYTEGYTKAVGQWLRGEDKPTHSDKSYHPDCPCEPCRNTRAAHASEQDAFERLSKALTGGNASTWEQLFHAAEQPCERTRNDG